MSGIGYRQILTFVLILVTTISAGCATIGDQRVDFIYQSFVYARGGSGDLYLVQEAPVLSGGATPIQWIIGDIRNEDGKKIGNIVTDMSPTDLLMDAFTQEFKTAGYNVVKVNSMPSGAARGLNLKSVSMKLEEKSGLIKIDAKCDMKLFIEPWRNGVAMTKLEYEAEHTDSDVTDREELLSITMLKTLQRLMSRSVPEIIKIFEPEK